jgi:hypothetical protein
VRKGSLSPLAGFLLICSRSWELLFTESVVVARPSLVQCVRRNIQQRYDFLSEIAFQWWRVAHWFTRLVVLDTWPLAWSLTPRLGLAVVIPLMMVALLVVVPCALLSAMLAIATLALLMVGWGVMWSLVEQIFPQRWLQGAISCVESRRYVPRIWFGEQSFEVPHEVVSKLSPGMKVRVRYQSATQNIVQLWVQRTR